MCKGDVPQRPEGAPHVAIENNARFRKFLTKEFIKGKGSGPSSWTAEYLLPLIKDKYTMDALTFFLSDLRNGRLPRDLKFGNFSKWKWGLDKDAGCRQFYSRFI